MKRTCSVAGSPRALHPNQRCTHHTCTENVGCSPFLKRRAGSLPAVLYEYDNNARLMPADQASTLFLFYSLAVVMGNEEGVNEAIMGNPAPLVLEPVL